MSIETELQDNLKAAMKAKDRNTLDAIRNARTEIQKALTAPNFDGDDGDAFHEKVIGAYTKKLAKALKTYDDLGDRGAQGAAKLRDEISYLSQWLPDKLDETSIRAIVRDVIESMGTPDPKQAGRVIGAVMKSHRDEVDAADVKKIVDEELAGA